MSNLKTEIRPYFLASSVFVVEGVKQFLLFDTERKENFILPVKYIQFIKNNRELIIIEAKRAYGLTNEEYEGVLEFLVSNNLIYFTDMKGFFRTIEPNFDYPAKISNAIIDIGEGNKFTSQIASYLTQINCFHLQIRYCREIKIEELKELVIILRSMFVMSVELTLAHSEKLVESEIASVIVNQVFIEAVVCYDAMEERKSSIVDKGQMLYFTEQPFSPKSCGIVSPSYFTSTIPAYTESTKHNSCLNRKISIDTEGNIKNCPSMLESFGNIKDTTLAEVIEKPGFKKYWNITKDSIIKCKDCEFRYICTDCRAYTTDPDDMYSDPLKCGYDPYTGEWEEWSGNPLKQKAIDFYGMRDMVTKEKPHQ